MIRPKQLFAFERWTEASNNRHRAVSTSSFTAKNSLNNVRRGDCAADVLNGVAFVSRFAKKTRKDFSRQKKRSEQQICVWNIFKDVLWNVILEAIE